LEELIFTSIKNTFSGKLWGWLVGSASTLLAILAFAKNFLNATIETSIRYGVYFFLALLVLRLILFFLLNVSKFLYFTYHESVYGDAIILLRDSFSKIHELRKIEEIDDKEFMEVMIAFCNNLKIIFDKKTKRNSSVSIKVPVKGNVNEMTNVFNLCRDSVATKTRDTDIYKQANHTIIGNTPYQKIVNNILQGKKDKLFYKNNDIAGSNDYENTSLGVYADGKLPYKSELVYPLIPHQGDRKANNYECIGFICVDCEVKNAFDDKYDVAIISGVADGIYDTITIRNRQKAKL